MSDLTADEAEPSALEARRYVATQLERTPHNYVGGGWYGMAIEPSSPRKREVKVPNPNLEIRLLIGSFRPMSASWPFLRSSRAVHLQAADDAAKEAVRGISVVNLPQRAA